MEKYMSNYRFRVVLGNVPGYNPEVISFARASGLQLSLEYEELAEGGLNDRPHVLNNPAKKNGTLVLERGVAGKKGWMARMRPGLHLGTWLRISLMDARNDKILRSYEIEDGVVTKWELSPLDAMGHEVLIEKLEIQYVGLKPS